MMEAAFALITLIIFPPDNLDFRILRTLLKYSVWIFPFIASCFILSSSRTLLLLLLLLLLLILSDKGVGSGQLCNQLLRRAKKRPSVYFCALVYISNTFLRILADPKWAHPWISSMDVSTPMVLRCSFTPQWYCSQGPHHYVWAEIDDSMAAKHAHYGWPLKVSDSNKDLYGEREILKN